MKINEYLDLKNIKYMYFGLEIKKDNENKTKKEIIRGKNTSLNIKNKEGKNYRDFTNDELKNINIDRIKTGTCKHITHDTKEYNVLDIDDNEEFKLIFKDHKDELLKSPYYLSSTKKLPHIFIKILNAPDKFNNNTGINNEKGKRVIDILTGIWAWVDKDIEILNPTNKIYEIEYNELLNIKKTYEDKHKEKRRTEAYKLKLEKTKLKREEIKKDTNKKTLDIPKNNILTHADYLLLDFITPQMIDDYDIWQKLGFILYDLFEGNDEGLKLYNYISNRSTKYDEKKNIEQYEKSKESRKKMTLGKIHYFLKENEPELYEIYGQTIKAFNVSLDQRIITRDIHTLYKDKYICSSHSPQVFLKFQDGIYKILSGDNEFKYLAVLYADELDKYKSSVIKTIEIYTKLATQTDKDKIDTWKNEHIESNTKFLHQVVETIKIVTEFCSNGKNFTSLLGHTSKLFYDENFEDKLNTNINLLSFGKHVYDLEKYEFRESKREDYLSIKCGITKEELEQATTKTNEEDKTPEEWAQEFFDSLFPEEHKKIYMYETLSSMLLGKCDGTINIWRATGSNGKSKLQEIIQIMLGDYYTTMTETVLTCKKDPGPNEASPHLYDTRYARALFINEPREGAKINNSFLKLLSGSDTITTRSLYKPIIKFKPQYSIFILCNLNFELNDINDNSMPRRIRMHDFKRIFLTKDEYENRRREDPDYDNYQIINENYDKEDIKRKIAIGLMHILLKTYKEVDEKYPGRKIAELKEYKEIKKKFIDSSNSFKEFFENKYEITRKPSDTVRMKDIKNNYIKFCKFHSVTPIKDDILKNNIVAAYGSDNFRKEYDYYKEHEHLDKQTNKLTVQRTRHRPSNIYFGIKEKPEVAENEEVIISETIYDIKIHDDKIIEKKLCSKVNYNEHIDNGNKEGN